MIVFNSLLKQGLLSIDESTLAFENGKLTAKISMGGYTEVEALPSIADAKEGVTYLVPTGDYFTMYVVDKTNGKWITLGTTANKTYEFGDGLVESGGVVTLDEKPKAIRDYFVNVDQWGAVVPYLAVQDTLDVAGDIATESALKGETLEIGSTIGADSTGLYDTRTTYPEDGKYVVTKYLLEERIKDLTLSVPTNVSQLNNDKNYATLTQVTGLLNQGINLMVAKSGSTMTGALTINNDLKALPLGYTTSMGVPAYGLQVSSTYGLQLFGTHFLNGTLWGDDGLKIVSNNLSLNTLDEAFISSDYANTTTFRAMPNDGTQATYKFEGWGWDDDSHTTKSARLGVRLLKPNQATTLEPTSVLNMREGDNRWVSLSGGTMTGYLNIPSPTASTHPTTKSYVDNLFASGGGLQNLSTGTGSLSIMGEATTSTNSVTLGKSADASASGSTSVGYKASSSKSSATALGANTKASGSYSTALGYYSQASGNHASALGDYAKARGGYSASVGYYAETSASYSIAIGSYANASANNSTALGRKATASENGVAVIAALNDDGTAKTQFKIIGKGSTASTNKLGGKSGIEYEEYDTSGNISTSGAISFEDLVSGGGGGGGNEFDSIKVATSVQMPYASTNDYQDIIKRSSSTLFVGRNIGSTSSGSDGDNSIEFNTNYGTRIHRDTNIITFPYQSGCVVVDSGLKTINGNSLLGSGDITISGGGGGGLENLATGQDALSILGAATTSVGSVSVGVGSTASGAGSTALGYGTTASGQYSVAIGFNAQASNRRSTAFGNRTTASGDGSTAFGYNAQASGINANAFGSFANASGNVSFAFGASAKASAYYSTALGNGANASDMGVTVLSAWDDSGEVRTQLYLIGAGSTMSTTYCDGEAGLGFTSYDGDGNIKSGTIKLSALMTENTDTFEPS